MTEAEWLTATDPAAMLALCLQRGRWLRKNRLFAVGCSYLVWDSLTDMQQHIVGEAELYADEQIGVGRFQFVWKDIVLRNPEPAEALEANVKSVSGWLQPHHLVSGFASLYAPTSRQEGLRVAECLVRCVYGNPFRPVTVDPACRTEAVVGLATGIYADRAFDLLPVLADALEDAGCADAAVLTHCRGPGPHVRGCWVVDLLLGKT